MNAPALEVGAILVVNHKHGVDVVPCVTTEAAEQQLALYVAEWWNEEESLKGTPMPSNPAEAVEDYFENVEETYTVIDLQKGPKGNVRTAQPAAEFSASYAQLAAEVNNLQAECEEVS